MMRTVRPSGNSAMPVCCSTVTPGKFATFWRRPVRRLNRVVLPEFGGPTSAMETCEAAVRGGSATAVPPQFAQPWHSLTVFSIAPVAPDLHQSGGFTSECDFRAVHLKHARVAVGRALARGNACSGQES